MHTQRATAVIVLALLGVFLSWSLLSVHHGEGSALDALCGETSGPSGCDVVNSSPYSSVAGVPLAALGLAFYASLALLVFIGILGGDETRAATLALAFWLLVLGLVVDMILLAVQAFVLHAFCNLCLLTYGVSAISLALLFPYRRQGTVARGFLSSSAGRVVLGAWLAGTLAFGVAAKSIDDAKAARASVRQDSLLGAPKGGGGGNAEAQRLQAILDDPQKLDQYLTDKAAKEYADAKVQTIDLKGVPEKGPAEAPVSVVEYSDFLCPHCKNLAMALDKYIPQSGNRLKLYFKHYPLESVCNPNVKRNVHPGSCNLALGGICASEQGKFWEYHDKVFETTPGSPAIVDVVRIGRELGLDAGALQKCLTSPGTAERLSREVAEASAAGVVGTPTIFISGKKLPRLNDFAQVVEQEAAKKGIPPTTP